MSTEIVPVTAQAAIVPAHASNLPELVVRAGGAARFAWDEFFYAERHNRKRPVECVWKAFCFVGMIMSGTVLPDPVGSILSPRSRSPAPRSGRCQGGARSPSG
jgi:hypothetical protein